MAQVPCSNCGSILERFPSRLKGRRDQYCDTDCLAEHRRRPVELACEVCAHPVVVKASRATQNEAITCSRDCLRALRSRNRVRHFGTEEARQAECVECGASFVRKPSQLDRYGLSFCSRSCRSQHIAEGSWVPCTSCGEDVWRKPSEQGKRYTFCSRECQRRIRGSLTPNWQGGKSIAPYAEGWGRSRSREIRERDGHRCRVCGETEALVVHHIDGEKFDHSDENLITLCRPCHSAVHLGRITIGDQAPEPLEAIVALESTATPPTK